jgi:hypothetical protein
MAYEIAVVIADVTDAMPDAQRSPLLPATTGAAQGREDVPLYADLPAAFAKGAWGDMTTTWLCSYRGGEGNQRDRREQPGNRFHFEPPA